MPIIILDKHDRQGACAPQLPADSGITLWTTQLVQQKCSTPGLERPQSDEPVDRGPLIPEARRPVTRWRPTAASHSVGD
jgi:hypothetical protein